MFKLLSILAKLLKPLKLERGMGYMVESFIFGSKRVVISKLSSFQEKNYCIAEYLAGIKLIWRFQPNAVFFNLVNFKFGDLVPLAGMLSAPYLHIFALSSGVH